jgi:hypothetical protein
VVVYRDVWLPFYRLPETASFLGGKPDIPTPKEVTSVKTEIRVLTAGEYLSPSVFSSS